MTNDRRHRIYESGRVESREAIQEIYMYDPKVPGSKEESHERYLEHNRRVSDELRHLGLYPEGDVNAYLRTNEVPASQGYPSDGGREMHPRIASAVGRLTDSFSTHQLAYLALTSKPEFVIRDQIALDLQNDLWPEYQVAREWRPAGKGSWRSDLAILTSHQREPVMLLEAKAMYSFDAVKKSREQYPLLIEADMTKSFEYALSTTLVYGLLIVVHPKNEIPEEAIPAVKYAAQVNSHLRPFPEQSLRRNAITFLDGRLRHIGPLTSKGSIKAGAAFGVETDVLYWLIGPVKHPENMPSEQAGLEAGTEQVRDLKR